MKTKLTKEEKELYKIVSEKKSKIQSESLNIWIEKDCKGCLAIATGVGKTKIGVDAAVYVKKIVKNATILILTPTENLRDSRWKDEFKQWKKLKIYEGIDRSCYASMSKIRNKHYDLVIMDEGHFLTPNNSIFFKNNQVDKILCLTATPPEDIVKQELFKINCPVIFEYSIEEAIKEGVSSDYEIRAIQFPLNNTEKRIFEWGKSYTEKEYYNWLENKVKYYNDIGQSVPQWVYLKRMQFLYNLKSRLNVAKFIMEKYIPEEERTIIFATSINHCEELNTNFYHSGNKPKSKENLQKFIDGEESKISSVNAINQGQDLPFVNSLIVEGVNSNCLTFTQRIGRSVRYRPFHKAIIWVLYSDCQTEINWVLKAFKYIDFNKIKHYNAKDLYYNKTIL